MSPLGKERDMALDTFGKVRIDEAGT